MLSPIGVFAASLVASLLLWLPSMLACLRGHLGLPAAGLRYLAAFAFCRLAFGGLARLVTHYHVAALMAAAEAAAAEDDAPKRRKQDHMAA